MTISKLQQTGDGSYIATVSRTGGILTFLTVSRRHNGVGNEWCAMDPTAIGYGLTRKAALAAWEEGAA